MCVSGRKEIAYKSFITLNGLWMKAFPKKRKRSRSHTSRIHLQPAIFLEPSVNSAVGRPTLRLPNRSLQSNTCPLHCPSVCLETWTAHFHVSILILRAISATSVLYRVSQLNHERNVWFSCRDARSYIKPGFF